MHVCTSTSNVSALRPPNPGTWKRGAVFLLSAFFLPAPGLALLLLFAHKFNIEAITPNNAHLKPFAGVLECSMHFQNWHQNYMYFRATAPLIAMVMVKGTCLILQIML